MSNNWLQILEMNAKATDFQVGNLHYNLVSLQDRTVEVAYPDKDEPNTLHGSSYKGDIIIPATVSYKGQEFRVIGIGVNAFYNSQVTSVILPEGIEYIKYCGFYFNKKLKSINLPKGLLKLEENAFHDCNIHSFTIPSTVTYIGLRGLPNTDKMVFEEGEDLLTMKVSNINTKELYIGRPVKMELSGLIDGFIMKKLTTLTIGKYVSNIKPFLYGDIPQNITIIIQNSNPPKLEKSLNNGLLVNSVLRIPKGSIDAYKNAEYYKDFFTIEEY